MYLFSSTVINVLVYITYWTVRTAIHSANLRLKQQSGNQKHSGKL
jgi:hypothetical protein